VKKTFTTFAALVFVAAMGTAAMAQAPNTDINQTEVTNFNHFLDSHPQAAQQLSSNPGLINDPQFVASHPHLHEFLENHPGVREEIHESPGQFMYREGHYGWVHGGGTGGYGPGIGAPQVNRFDNGYLDEHPGVARQLGQNPGLVNNPQFMASHPGLREYFENHPGVRTDLRQHPDRFMNDEWRHDAWHQPGYAHPLANTDHYLDQHPDVAQQLDAHPGLVNNRQYVASHPGLHEFIAAHPVARSEWKNHPYRYMQHEQHYNQKH
jgi:hypothetical protein